MTYMFLCLLVLLTTNACVSYESLLNYNESPRIPTTPQEITNYSPILIQVNDVLLVQISGLDPESVAPFVIQNGTSEGAASTEFVVNNEGEVILPTLGAIAVEGETTEIARKKIREKLEPYFSQPPIVNVRLRSFKVNMNGEVQSPGPVFSANERLTIVEAVTMAGDFTSYARRDSILIVREMKGVRTFGYVDFNSSAVFNSPYFYLQQNDVVYVQPARTKVNAVRDPASRFLPWITAAVSVTAFVFSIIRLR